MASKFRIRGYNRDEGNKVRDYSLFAIACEGAVTEPRYFQPFDNEIDRIKVDIIEGDLHKSSPKHVFDKAVMYETDYQISDESNDTLWLVIDVDRWTREQIDEIQGYCKDKKNWSLIISNPCFEIWLLYHYFEDLSNIDYSTSQSTKKEINKLKDSTHLHFDYLVLMEEAIKNAQKNDLTPDHYYPNPKETKVYKLALALLERIGKNKFEKFIEETIPRLKQEYKNLTQNQQHTIQ